MLYAVRRDLSGKRNRHHFFLRCDKSTRSIDDLIDVIQGIFNDTQPGFIHHLMHNLVLLLQGIIAGLDHLK